MRRASQITLMAGGVLVAAAWAMASLDLFIDSHPVTRVLAEVIAVLLIVLAWRYRRDRLAVVAALIAGSNLLIRSGRADGSLELAVIALAVSADLVVIAVTRDRPVQLPTGILWVTILGLQCWAAMIGVDMADARLQRWLLHPSTVPAAMVGATVAVAIVFALRRGAFEASLIWVATAATVIFAGGQDARSAALLLIAATLAVLTGVFEDSYRLAFHDELTGLPGRRALDEGLRNLSGVFTIAMADVDRFKRFNDRHGHDAGDQALRMVADEMAKVEGGGRAFRYGGEEFAIVFPGKTVADTRESLDSLRQTIAERRFALRGPDRPRTRPDQPKTGTRPAKRVTVTVSIGVAATDSRRRSADAVIRAADRALYRAKKAGRNRVVAAGDRLKR